MVKLIFGCGFLGERVGRRWLRRGERTVAVTRSAARAEELAGKGFESRIADVTRPETLADLPTAKTVLYAVGYDRGSGLPRAEVQIEGLRNVLEAMSRQLSLPGTGAIRTGPHDARHDSRAHQRASLRSVCPAMLIFISSTGVYGNCEGGWIDEDTPCHPDRESGRMALAAEETLRSSALGACATVLRLAGLYGPGRIPKIDDLLAGGPLAVAAGAVVNLIHVDDAASVVLAAERQARPSATYVVSDGHPVPRREFYRYLAELLRLPPPTFVEPSPREGRSPRGAGNKRVRNHRMLEELHVRLDYPSYREGLAAIA